MNAELPIKLVVKVEAANGTTALIGLERICELLKGFRFPEAGRVIENEFWRVTVLESVSSLVEKAT